jgi:anti-anti-sigma factor
MDMQVSEVGGVTKVALVGRLDTAGASRIETAFTARVVPPGRATIVDLSGVSFLASLGIRMLISAARGLAGRNAKLVLFGAPGPVAEVIETAALSTLIPVAASEAEAVAMAAA